MKIDVHVHVHHDGCDKQLDRIEWRLDEMSGRVDHIIKQGEAMALDLSKITAAVTLIKGRAASIEALVKGLADLVRGIPTTDPTTQTAIDALAGQLDTEAAGMQAAIDANPLPHETPPAAIALPDVTAGATGVIGNVAGSFGSGGIAPFSYLLVGGALPPDVTLDATNGNLTLKAADNSTDPPTPAAIAVAGDFAFTVQKQDADAGTVDETESFTLHVA